VSTPLTGWRCETCHNTEGTRKIELFGRHHNTQKNWLTLGNQCEGIQLLETEVVDAFKAKYGENDAEIIKELLKTSPP
jgi:hypothetical protein